MNTVAATSSGAGYNLTCAKQACANALSKMKGVNWDQYRGHASYETRTASPDFFDRNLYAEFGGIRGKYDSACGQIKVERLKCIGRMAEQKGLGNCGEFANSAFAHLSGKVRPLEVVHFPPGAGDHQFVIIGRDQNSPLGDYTRWGVDAVICDPWAQGFKNDPEYGAYPASQFKDKMSVMVGQPSSSLVRIAGEL